ncbi:MAG: desulfoferrodoxin family protein [Coriobacteriia bacterium]|nr:desulfoferrodoxin family protein [Coriobacteriia bacterium]
MADAPTITVVTDFATAGDFEKKHTPFITLEAQGDLVVVHVEVGHEIAHPNGTDHYITSIELFADGAPIARLDLSPAVTFPRFCVPVSLPAGTVVRAIEHCNLHGLFAYDVTL